MGKRPLCRTVLIMVGVSLRFEKAVIFCGFCKCSQVQGWAFAFCSSNSALQEWAFSCTSWGWWVRTYFSGNGWRGNPRNSHYNLDLPMDAWVVMSQNFHRLLSYPDVSWWVSSRRSPYVLGSLTTKEQWIVSGENDRHFPHPMARPE